MTPIDTAQIFQFPVDRNGLRDIAIIGTISHDQPGFSYRRVDGFFIPAAAADRSDYVLHQHGGENTDLSWVVEVMKQSLLQVWRERQIASGGLPVPGAELTVQKVATEDLDPFRALVALDYYKALTIVRGMAETASTLNAAVQLMSGRLYGQIEQKHPAEATS